LWTGKQPVDCALVGRTCAPDKAIVPAIETLDIELLAWLDSIRMPKLGRQNDLTLGGDNSLHIGKISSYLEEVKRR